MFLKFSHDFRYTVQVLNLQEQVKAAAAAAAASEGEADGELSPLPAPGGLPPRRRGGISAEPVTEEDATSYVKKVTALYIWCNKDLNQCDKNAVWFSL